MISSGVVSVVGGAVSRCYLGPFPKGTRVRSITLVFGNYVTATGGAAGGIYSVSIAAFVSVPPTDTEASFSGGVNLCGSSPLTVGGSRCWYINSGTMSVLPLGMDLDSRFVLGVQLGGTVGTATFTGVLNVFVETDELSLI